MTSVSILQDIQRHIPVVGDIWRQDLRLWMGLGLRSELYSFQIPQC